MEVGVDECERADKIHEHPRPATWSWKRDIQRLSTARIPGWHSPSSKNILSSNGANRPEGVFIIKVVRNARIVTRNVRFLVTTRGQKTHAGSDRAYIAVANTVCCTVRPINPDSRRHHGVRPLEFWLGVHPINHHIERVHG